jgi:transcriptional regulator with XRE-family HTH domain
MYNGLVDTGLTTADLVRLKRTQMGLSARALSAAANQSDSYVSKLEAGKVEPSLKTFARLAKVLKFTPRETWCCLMVEAEGD